MNYSEYIKIFKNNDEYHTHQKEKPSLISRLLSKNRFVFYYRFAKVIIKGAKIARKGLYDQDAWIENSLDNLFFLEDNGGIFHITGIDNLRRDIDKDKGIVIVANHMSTLETVVLPSIVRPNRKVTFAVKDSLIEGNTFGAIMRATEPIVVGRKSPREDLVHVLKEGEKKLNEGISLIIFPQSTRTQGFDPQQFNTLGIKLAKRAKTKIIPLALKTDFWGNGKYIKEIGKIDPKKEIFFCFDKPMEINGSGKEEHKYIIDFIQRKQKEWTR